MKLHCVTTGIFIFISTSYGSLEDFKSLNNDDNSDAFLNTVQIIRKYGYPAENYTVLTEDGYYIEIHRIPHGKNEATVSEKPPVILVPPYTGSSSVWLLQGPDQSLPFLLADEGYDVWLANIRGNAYARTHKTLTTKDQKFWDFTFHEHGIYDLPSQIQLILNHTKKSKVIAVGHSMGPTVIFIMSSLKPEYQNTIQGSVLYAPIAYMGNARGGIRYLAPVAKNVALISKFLTEGELTGTSALFKFVTENACGLSSLQRNFCAPLIFLLAGNSVVFRTSLLPTIIRQDPSGSSVKGLIHFLQLVESGKFQHYNYGLMHNLKIYNHLTPPEYNLRNITFPIYIFHSEGDFLATVPDVQHVAAELPNVKKMRLIDIRLFNHMDFLFAKNIKNIVYDKTIEFINEIAG